MRCTKTSADSDTLCNGDMGTKSIGVLGLKQCTILNGLLPVHLLTKFLCANSTVGNTTSQFPRHFFTRHLSKFSKL